MSLNSTPGSKQKRRQSGRSVREYGSLKEGARVTEELNEAAYGRLTRRAVKVCDAAGAFMDYWGFKAIYGRVWTLLALRHDPMSQVQIAETLGVSRSLVSLSVAELLKYGLIRPTSNHRNAPYEAVMDVWPVISDVLRQREWMMVESVRTALESTIEEAEILNQKSVPHPYNMQNMRLLLNMSDMAQAFLNILMRIRMPQSVDGLGSWVTKASSFVKRLSSFG